MYGLLSNKPCAKTVICRISSEKRKRTLPSMYQHLKLLLFILRTKAVLLNILNLRSATPLQKVQALPQILSHCSKKERGEKMPEKQLDRQKSGAPAFPCPAGVQTPSSLGRPAPHSASCTAQDSSSPDGTLGGRSWAAVGKPPCDACWMLGRKRRRRRLDTMPQG